MPGLVLIANDNGWQTRHYLFFILFFFLPAGKLAAEKGEGEQEGTPTHCTDV